MAVFGDVAKTPAIQTIQEAYGRLARDFFPPSESEQAKPPAELLQNYVRFASERLRCVSVPAVSSKGARNRAARISEISPLGADWVVFMEEGAEMSPGDANLIPALIHTPGVFSAFHMRGQNIALQDRLVGWWIDTHLDDSNAIGATGEPIREFVRRVTGHPIQEIEFASLDPRLNRLTLAD